MACSYIPDDTTTSFIADLNDIIEEEKILSQQIPNLSTNKAFSLFKQSLPEDRVILLKRGGCVLKTKIGPIQYGLPPETVKDSLSIGIEVPTYYIIPSKRFDKKNGINVAEFEFPAYFNFFVKKRKITLICTSFAEKSIRSVFQETLLGPTNHDNIAEDFYPSISNEYYPNFKKELSLFSKNPQNPNEPLNVDMLLSFLIFDQKTQSVDINENGHHIEIKKEDDVIIVLQDGIVFEKIKDIVVLPGDSFTDIIQQEPQQQDQPVIALAHIMIEPPSTPGKRGAVTLWNKKSGHTQSLTDLYNINIKNDETFSPPDFGITVIGNSHGFDPKGSTSGFILWIYGKGIMVDPPPFSSQYLKKLGIPSVIIVGIIITHCHADHDAGAFHKVLDEQRVQIITTRTIMNSFLRKYSALSDMSIEELKSLFIFRPAIIGTTINLFGGYFRFFYALHTIPCIGFEVSVMQKSIYYSADTFYYPEQIKEYYKQGYMTKRRYEQLAKVKFTHDLILHESGVPPIHTPQKVLQDLPTHIKNRLYLIHIAEKDLIKDSGLKIARAGIENTIILHPSNSNQHIKTLRRLDLLSSIDIFENLTIKNIKSLLDSLIEEAYTPKQIVVKEGTVGNKFYIIESGLARVYSDTKGNEFERFCSVGDYFGETALICHGGKRMATVEAFTDLILLTLEKHDFWFIFGDGMGGEGPVIRKFTSLSDARKSKAITVLYKNSVFSGMEQSQKTQLEMILKEEDVEKNQVIWRIGDKATFGFIIKKGGFEFVDCPEQDLDEFEAGTFIGEIRAMMNDKPLSTTVQSCRRGKIFKIMSEDLISFLKKNPGLQLLFQDQKYIE